MMIRKSLLPLLFLGVLLAPGAAWASAESEVAAAAGQGQSIFVVVTQGDARGTDRAIQIARGAQRLVPKSAVVLLDRGLAENRGLVERYRVLGAPVPLVLVVAPNGIVAGGALLKDATPEALARTVPTPKKAEMLAHFTRKLPVFVVVSGRTMVEQRGAIFEACTQAVQRLERKAATVVVDQEDEAEKAWRAELKVSPRETVPIVIVFNAKGEKTQVFRGAVTAEQLIQAALKKVECCPGGSC